MAYVRADHHAQYPQGKSKNMPKSCRSERKLLKRKLFCGIILVVKVTGGAA